jgi:hypothetical protein
MTTLRLVPPSGSPIEITEDRALVGRDPSCEIVLNDGSVSRKHAQLERRGDEWAVVDQGSANGTFLDSQRIGEGVLKPGQDLRFGAVAFKVEMPGTPPDDNSPTLAGEPGATLIQPVPLVQPSRPAPPPAPAPPPPPPAPPRSAAAPPPPPPPAPGRPSVPRAGGMPVSPVPPPSGAGAAPPKKGRGPMFWVGVGCCSCLFIMTLLGGGCFAALYFGTAAPVAAARAEISAVKAGDIDAAYALLSSEYRQQVSRGSFEAFVTKHPGLRENTDSTFMSRSVQNDTAKLAGVLTHSGGAEPVIFELVKENGSWKISSLRVGDEQP